MDFWGYAPMWVKEAILRYMKLLQGKNWLVYRLGWRSQPRTAIRGRNTHFYLLDVHIYIDTHIHIYYIYIYKNVYLLGQNIHIQDSGLENVMSASSVYVASICFRNDEKQNKYMHIGMYIKKKV